MDPAGLSNAEWTEIGKFLFTVWCLVGFVVLFAANMLVGHIFIPSLVSSYHMPAVAQRARPLFYLLAVGAFAGAIYELSKAIELADVIRTIYEDYWI